MNVISLACAGITAFRDGWFHFIGNDVLDFSVGSLSIHDAQYKRAKQPHGCTWLHA